MLSSELKCECVCVSLSNCPSPEYLDLGYIIKSASNGSSADEMSPEMGGVDNQLNTPLLEDVQLLPDSCWELQSGLKQSWTAGCAALCKVGCFGGAVKSSLCGDD